MVIDTSAVLAILQDEPLAPALEAAIEDDPVRLMATPSALEAAIVIEARYGEAGGRELDLLLHKAGVELVSFDADQMEMARRAYRSFGKGHHEAGLNFGDCISYALAQRTGEALLYVGDDFAKTDIESVPLHTPGDGSD
jgi:ribonuclease VapC